jgi:hypothetical protein
MEPEGSLPYSQELRFLIKTNAQLVLKVMFLNLTTKQGT